MPPFSWKNMTKSHTLVFFLGSFKGFIGMGIGWWWDREYQSRGNGVLAVLGSTCGKIKCRHLSMREGWGNKKNKIKKMVVSMHQNNIVSIHVFLCFLDEMMSFRQGNNWRHFSLNGGSFFFKLVLGFLFIFTNYTFFS